MEKKKEEVKESLWRWRRGEGEGEVYKKRRREYRELCEKEKEAE